ncbi:hypothetical protein GT044_41550 [Streptomyces sp. SID335]|uniref:Uncharacterized protein n=3 Tax=Streptomyces TaxID=1883 RepID=A0A5P2BJS0_STRVZ|nr:hypothetical protein [Streptomyces sp. SID335]MYZ16411.1 hypothetical protein [Streptomyces sp. SID337]QES30642.1 hypothetical protein DEJ47_33205 [Streptomyces venezuelae]
MTWVPSGCPSLRGRFAVIPAPGRPRGSAPLQPCHLTGRLPLRWRAFAPRCRAETSHDSPVTGTVRGLTYQELLDEVARTASLRAGGE